MGICRVVARLGVLLVAVVAILVGCLLANVPGQLGLWKYVDSYHYYKGIIPVIHSGDWGFNHSSLGPESLKGRTVLVTGANAGLGLSTVQYLATRGATVIMGCRSQKNCDETARIVKNDAPSATLVPLVLDLSSFKSIKQFAVEVNKTTQKLNSLILNAGIFQYPYGLTEDGLEQVIGVNHFGHAYLVQLLEGRMKQSATKDLPGTIVVVTSNLHYESYPEGVRLSVAALNDPATFDELKSYGQSKLANVLYAQELAVRLRPYGILVNSVHPGGVDTNITNKLGETIQTDYPFLSDVFLRVGVVKKIKELLTLILWSPKDAALTQLYAAVSPEVISKRIHGKYFHPIARETIPCPVHASNVTLQKGFWDFTEEVLLSKAK
jgi:NAD(P)-dependent dehydrogenase (short-subunit alcohol dehydrogenase family)